MFPQTSPRLRKPFYYLRRRSYQQEILGSPRQSQSSRMGQSLRRRRILCRHFLGPRSYQSLSLSLHLSITSSMFILLLCLTTFFFCIWFCLPCVRPSCALRTRRTRKAWGFWRRLMRPLKCTSTVVAGWTSAASTQFSWGHCSYFAVILFFFFTDDMLVLLSFSWADTKWLFLKAAFSLWLSVIHVVTNLMNTCTALSSFCPELGSF